MIIKNTTWGIWGYGVVGKSVARFLHAQGAHVAVYDHKVISDPETHIYKVYQPDQLPAFLEEQSRIVPSPGVDISQHYATYDVKIVTELDLFYTFFKKPIIAITGSVGKTTITRIISMLLEKLGNKVLTGGNIGLGMCDLIAHQDQCTIAVLEVSSFQLEHCKQFAPSVAIITPFHPNHLDRHKTMHAYRAAKLNILTYQTKEDIAIIPQVLMKYCKKMHGSIIGYQNNRKDMLIHFLPSLTFTENMNIIAKVIRALDIDPFVAAAAMRSIVLQQEHRLEHVITHNDVQFINDSKSTTPVSTRAAVEYYKEKTVHLLLGGLSKGICRKDFIQSLQKKVAKVYCFGSEASQLYNWCTMHNITAAAYADLAQCVADAYKEAQKETVILLSPGGSSYDLYNNYEERGKDFKDTIIKLIRSSNEL